MNHTPDTIGEAKKQYDTGRRITNNPLIGTTRVLTEGNFKGEQFQVLKWSPKGRPFVTLSGYYHIRFRGKLQWLEGREMREISEEVS